MIIILERKFSFSSLELKQPVKMAFDISGNIYITDNFRNAVVRFNSAGEYLGYFGRKGRGKGELLMPKNVLLTEDFLIVQESKNRRIQFFDLDGNF